MGNAALARSSRPRITPEAYKLAAKMRVPTEVIPSLDLDGTGEVTPDNIRQAVAFVDGTYPGNNNGVIDTPDERVALEQLVHDPLSIRMLNLVRTERKGEDLANKVRDWANDLRFDVVLGALHAQKAKDRFMAFAKTQRLPEDYIVLAGACVWAFGFAVPVNLAAVLLPFAVVHAGKKLRPKNVRLEEIQAQLNQNLFDLEPEERAKLRKEMVVTLREILVHTELPDDLKEIGGELERFFDLRVESRVKLIERLSRALQHRIHKAGHDEAALQELQSAVPRLLKRPKVPEVHEFYRELLIDYAQKCGMKIVGSEQNLEADGAYYHVESGVPRFLRMNPFKITADDVVKELNSLPPRYRRPIG